MAELKSAGEIIGKRTEITPEPMKGPPLVEFPVNKVDMADFLAAVKPQPNNASDKEPWPDLFKGIKDLWLEGPAHPTKSCGALSLWVPDGKKVVVDDSCNFKVVPATKAETAAQQKQRAYTDSPEFRKKQAEENAWIMRQTRE